MIEIIITNYLAENLNVPVFNEHQENEPDSFVLIDRTGGTKKNYLKTATIAFQSYAESKYKASLLNEELKQTIEKIEELPEISGVHLNSDYDYTDVQTKRYRYQAVYDINYY
ncbi:hypothetical protein [Streptococcus porcinus]|uniref:Phage protein n=1 Tax=Streptococcus porcinus TaxID=1340 RepID=A0A7V9WT20_STRPO|nr:hypothetical protein [Streptococcus porcinus]MBA2796560.1 hypothetical protein [Streptococcus porcinus]